MLCPKPRPRLRRQIPPAFGRHWVAQINLGAQVMTAHSVAPPSCPGLQGLALGLGSTRIVSLLEEYDDRASGLSQSEDN